MKKNETRSTESLIAEMTSSLQPSRSADSELVFFMKWLVAAALFVAFWIAVIPTPMEFAARVQKPWFLINGFFWFLATAVSALVIYRSRIPGLKISAHRQVASVVIAALLIGLTARLTTDDLHTEFFSEMNWYRGRCGPLILGMGLTWALAMFWWVRRGAPTNFGRTGLWIGISTGCLASLAMQVICAHENPLHILIWHVTPVTMLAVGGMAAGRRWLRW